MAWRFYGVLFCVVLHASNGQELLDMTHTFDNTSLYWPNGQAAFNLNILSLGPTAAGFWYQGDEVLSGSHLGTHMDAPNHFFKDRWAIDDIPIVRLVARPAVVIDIRQKAALSPDSNVTLDDINRYELMHGVIPRGAVIIQCSGWSQKYPDKKAVFGNDIDDTTDFHFPAFSVEAVKWLIERREIVGIAVDTPSVDYGQSESSFPTHVLFASHNVYALENVKDTCALPPAGATVNVFPSKIRGASGAPVRIIASWDSRFTNWQDNPSGTTRVSVSCLLMAISFIAHLITSHLCCLRFVFS